MTKFTLKDSFDEFIPNQKFFKLLVNNFCGRTFKYGNSEIIFSKSPSKDDFVCYAGGIYKSSHGFDSKDAKKIFRCKFEMVSRINFMDSNISTRSNFCLNVWSMQDNYVSYAITDNRTSSSWVFSHKVVEYNDFIELMKNPIKLI